MGVAECERLERGIQGLARGSRDHPTIGQV